MREPKPLSAAHKAKIAAGMRMRDYHRKCHNGGARVLLGTQTLSPNQTINRKATDLCYNLNGCVKTDLNS